MNLERLPFLGRRRQTTGIEQKIGSVYCTGLMFVEPLLEPRQKLFGGVACKLLQLLDGWVIGRRHLVVGRAGRKDFQYVSPLLASGLGFVEVRAFDAKHLVVGEVGRVSAPVLAIASVFSLEVVFQRAHATLMDGAAWREVQFQASMFERANQLIKGTTGAGCFAAIAVASALTLGRGHTFVFGISLHDARLVLENSLCLASAQMLILEVCGVRPSSCLESPAAPTAEAHNR